MAKGGGGALWIAWSNSGKNGGPGGGGGGSGGIGRRRDRFESKVLSIFVSTLPSNCDWRPTGEGKSSISIAAL